MFFNIFINDIFLSGKKKGIRIPGLLDRCKGLLFADDLASLCASKTSVYNSIVVLSQWASHWRMYFNVGKCGILEVPPKGCSTFKVSSDEFILQNEIVPIVRSYKYLGVIIDSRLDFELMIENRVSKARDTIRKLKHFLMCPSIPLYARIIVCKAVFVPIALYGGEIWGMNQRRVRVLETLRVSLLRLLIGSRAGSLAALGREFHFPYMYAIASSRRTRAYFTWQKSRLWIGRLLAFPFHLERKSFSVWTNATRRWLLCWSPRVVKHHTRISHRVSLSLKDIDNFRNKVLFFWWRRREKSLSHSKHYSRVYKRFRFYESSSFMRYSLSPDKNLGFFQILLLRLGIFPFAPRLVILNRLDLEWRSR